MNLPLVTKRQWLITAYDQQYDAADQSSNIYGAFFICVRDVLIRKRKNAKNNESNS